MKKITTALLLIIALSSFTLSQAQENFLGEIKLVPYNFDPVGWAECDGRLLSIAQNSALFALLGTTYGGDGETTFALPDLRGRVPMGRGNGPGLTPRSLGQKTGAETNTLTLANMPAHNHTVNAVAEDGNQSTPEGNLPAGTKVLDTEYSDASASTATMNTSMINNSGGGQAVNNVQPVLVLRYIIALQGTFPSQG